jgi:hypothetical protein
MRVEAGLTKQPKQYEAVRAGVTVEIPCGLSDKEMKAAYERASAIVETCLEKQMERTLAFSEEF